MEEAERIKRLADTEASRINYTTVKIRVCASSELRAPCFFVVLALLFLELMQHSGRLRTKNACCEKAAARNSPVR